MVCLRVLTPLTLAAIALMAASSPSVVRRMASTSNEHIALAVDAQGDAIQERSAPVADENGKVDIVVSSTGVASPEAEQVGSETVDVTNPVKSYKMGSATSGKDIFDRADSRVEFDFDEDDDNAGEAALDELEAMTIEAALLKKHPPPPPAARDCKWSDWQNDGDCSQTCGGGWQPRKRTEKVKAAHGGKKCECDIDDPPTAACDYEIKKPCDNEACPTTTTLTTTTAMIMTTPMIESSAMTMRDVNLLSFLALCVTLNLNIR